MRYFIGCLIKGKAEKYQKILIDKICGKFNVRNLNDYIPAHFTLKAPFETDDIGSVEELLERVCGKGKVSTDSQHKNLQAGGVRIDGIGNFHRRVIYLNGKPSSGVLEFLRELNDGLRGISWMEFSRYDLTEGNLHSTLVRVKDYGQFEDVMKFLSDEKPFFKFEFDNVVIFRKRGSVWEVYREFELG